VPVRQLPLLVLATLVASAADAQIIRRPGMPFQEPTTFLSFGVGHVQGWTVHDSRDGSSSTWEFGDATQFNVALERSFGAGVTLGVTGTTARVPLHYSSIEGGDVFFQTDADARVSQALATLHLSSGGQFHTVLELSSGATLYSGFKARGTGVTIGPPSMDADFAYGFGYGAGYNFTPRFSLDVVQSQITSLHQKPGLSAGTPTSARLTSTRITARFGLGAH
jgi:hypothetical protein